MSYLVLQQTDKFMYVIPCMGGVLEFEPHTQNDRGLIVHVEKNDDGKHIRGTSLSVKNITEFDLVEYVKNPKNTEKLEMSCSYEGKPQYYSIEPKDLILCLDYKEKNKKEYEHNKSLPSWNDIDLKGKDIFGRN